MLVLSRKRNERIRITKDITITVVDIRGDKVRIGIEAPKWVGIWRLEIAPEDLQAPEKIRSQEK